jgi:hypothetical protein
MVLARKPDMLRGEVVFLARCFAHEYILVPVFGSVGVLAGMAWLALKNVMFGDKKKVAGFFSIFTMGEHERELIFQEQRHRIIPQNISL